MTRALIYEYFKTDKDIIKYYDPTSDAGNIEEIAEDVYNKLLEYQNNSVCEFVADEIGYIYYTEKLAGTNQRALISFSVKSEYRTKDILIAFWGKIKNLLGDHFNCYLFNKNERAIKYLMKCGMQVKNTNDLFTRLII